jgi:hypothetical protein
MDGEGFGAADDDQRRWLPPHLAVMCNFPAMSLLYILPPFSSPPSAIIHCVFVSSLPGSWVVALTCNLLRALGPTRQGSSSRARPNRSVTLTSLWASLGPTALPSAQPYLVSGQRQEVRHWSWIEAPAPGRCTKKISLRVAGVMGFM